MTHPRLVQHFTEHFLRGESFKTIGAARRQAAEILGEPVSAGSPLTKVIDESLEAALVRVARSIAATPATPDETYDRLVDLHERQPVLGVRSSTSISQQAYSTPLPIAYLASVLADITPEHRVYEPTAGHGALLIATNPANTTVNELNPDRAADLRSQGYTVTEQDATDYQPEKRHDRIICNPPFGVAKYTNGRIKQFELPGNRRGTTQIDQVIALRALEVMKPDGRAVLILGGKLGDEPARRSERYNSLESRGFFRVLYDQYKVTQHVSIWGSLYRKQGAGFPIDLIVIEGKGKSELHLPAARVPPIFKSFSDLKELIPHDRLQHLSPNLETRPGGLSEPDAGARALRFATDQQGRILDADGRANRLADATLDGANGRDPAANPSSPLPSPESVESRPNAPGFDRGQWRSATSVVVDPGVGRDLDRAQRYPPATDLDGVSRARSDSRHAGGDAAVEPDARPDDAGGLAGGVDLRHGNRQRPVNQPGENPMDNVQSFDVPYIPRSQGRIGETIIPTNMAAAAQKALDKLESAVGNIDVFVQQRLGYDSPEQLWRHFYAEQIDAIALAFHQRDQGNIFLNGDQTGNGKGRFGAANILDAQRQGYIPVFVTQKPNLYNAMLNDLADVGRPSFRVFATDNKLKLTLDDGRRLVTGSAADQEAEMQRIVEQGLGRRSQAIFTTYSQLQTVGAEEPFRRAFFRAIAPRAVFIFDEAHEAGGVSKLGAWKTNAPPNRADFVRELVDRCAGAVFMSATSIKSSTVIDLYARRSDARHAVEHISNLEIILKDGGVPLQQMFATKFVASGQMIRRGRSMAGISFDSKVVSVDRDVAESISAIMRAINGFDEAKQEALRKLDKELKAEAKAISIDNAVGQAGVRSANFTSLMHNAIDQSLLAQKAEVTVQEAISAIERGEKPLIAVASTMDSFIDWYAKENGIKPGDPVSLTFGNVLHRYLERSRDILVKDYEGKSTRHRLTDEQLGPDGITAYQDALDLIEDTDLSGIPLSSIDYIKWRLTQSGYRVDEITGRENIIEYSRAGITEYGLRPEKEVSPQGRIDIVNRFNRGDLDVVILNRSGATGISLHASEQFVDQRPRHMIVAQPERDVNLVMQMLGRINRFGQVNKPQFTLLMSDLPAEKRLGALLAKKMAELNANVTAARESDLSIANVVDFMNVYGEAVITEILEEDIELQAKLGYPLKSSEDSDIATIKRVTGRIPLLTMREQEDLYTLIESETQDLITQKEAMGESVLRADQLDLEARTIAQMEVIPDESGVDSEFTGPVCLEIVDAKVPIKPLTQLQVVNAVREQLNLEAVKDVGEHDFDGVGAIAQQQAQSTLTTVRQATEAYRRQALVNCKSDSGRDKLNGRLDEQLFHLGRVLQETPPGTPVRVVSPEGNIFYGVVSRISQKGQNGSPAAPTNWKVQVLIDHRSRQLTIPLAKFNRGKDDAATQVSPQDRNWDGEDIYTAFDIRQTQSQRTEMQIFTGNPIKAYEKFPKGKFVNYTNDQGEVMQGLVMPASFDIQETLREEVVAFHQPHQVKAFLTEVTQHLGSVKTLDELFTVKTQVGARFGNPNATGFVLQTVKSGAGDRYSLDPDIITAAGAEFYSVSDRMECIVPEDRIDAVLRVILNEKHWTLAAFDFKDQARNFLGVKLPEFQDVERQAAPVIPTIPRNPPPVETTLAAERVLPATGQRGAAEKNVATFLEQAGLAAAVMVDPEFYLKVPNEPFIPLAIERHDTDLHFIHWLTDSAGDLFIDSEMIFQLDAMGRLTLLEVAVQNALTGGELRGKDKSFAQLFSGNILEQGFAQAAQQTQEPQVQAVPEPENLVETLPPAKSLPKQKAWEWQQVDRSDLTATALAYLQLKDQHPEALVLQRSPAGDFYQAFFSDAQAIAKAVDFVVIHKDLGDGARHAPVLLIPTGPLSRFTEYLQAQGFAVVVDEGVHRVAVGTVALPLADAAQWAMVRHDLTVTRGLPEAWIDGLHRQGLIYADGQGQAVFLRHGEAKDGQAWSRGHPTGATVLGPGADEARGEAGGEAGWFWIRRGQGEVQRLVLVESAIAALSLAALEQRAGQPGGSVYLATAGAMGPVAALQAMMDRGGQVVVAFAADRTGEQLAWRVAAAVPGVQRRVPAVGQDWQERWLARGPADVEPSRQSDRGDQQMPQGLWQWYRVAAAVGRSPAYLQRITEVAREAVAGKPLSQQATAAMQRDLAQRDRSQAMAVEV